MSNPTDHIFEAATPIAEKGVRHGQSLQAQALRAMILWCVRKLSGARHDAAADARTAPTTGTR